MSESFRFTSLTVSQFRGFREAQTLDLDASAVILSGPNGTGKTSVFDAIQWLLLGELERLMPMRTRQNDEHIVNRYAQPSMAQVDATVRINGTSASLRRVGNYSQSILEIELDSGEEYRGEEASDYLEDLLSPSAGMALKPAMLTSGILQQDVMRRVLEANPQERYSHLSGLMGLGVIEDFQLAVEAHVKATRQASTDARESLAEVEERVAGLQEELDELERISGVRPSAQAIRSRLQALFADLESALVWSGTVEDLTSETALALLGEVADLRRTVGDLIERVRSLDQQLSGLTTWSSSDIEAQAELAAELDQRLQAARSERTAAREHVDRLRSASERFVELAALAVPLLTERCPVCEQPIESEAVASRLQHAASEFPELVEAEERLVAAHAELDRVQEARDAAEVELRERRRGLEEVESLTLRRDAALQGLRALARPERALRTTEAFINSLLEGTESVGGLRGGELEAELSQLSAVLLGSETSRAQTIRRDLEKLAKTRADRRERLEAASAAAARAKSLNDATTAARVSVIADRFGALEPLVMDIYRRLDPHPAFTALSFDHQIYRNKGRTVALVHDEAEGISSDPLLVFSTAQANIAALAFFLATGWAARSGKLPFALLDDPLQSMDDVNVLGFADLCRYVRQDRQLIISTHERRFAQLLERKLHPRLETEDTLVHRFGAWERSGPTFETIRLVGDGSEGAVRLLSVS